MSADTASNEGTRSGTVQPDRAPNAFRVLAMAAVCIGLAALAGATFVLSYSGIHALALHAGITPRLARGYPLLIDAMLVIVLAAVLALRGADLPSRLLAWTTLMAVLAAAAGADAFHAAGQRLPRHAAAITAAVVPWVLVFLAFALLLAMLRHARLRRLATVRELAVDDDPLAWRLPDGQHEEPRPAATGAAAIVPGFEVSVPQPQPASAPPLDLDAETDATYPVGPVRSPADQPELAVDAEPEPDDPTTDEAAPDPAGFVGRDQVNQADQAEDPAEPAETAAATEQDEGDDPDMPVFHRMWSSPAPPESRG